MRDSCVDWSISVSYPHLDVYKRQVWIRPASGTVRAGLVAETSDDGGRLLTALSLEPIPLSSVSVPVREVRR